MPVQETIAVVEMLQRASVKAVEVIEREETKRAEIAAEAAIVVERIRARRDVLVKLIEEDGATRRAGLAQLARAIETAAATHNLEELRLLLQGFIGVLNENPVERLRETDALLRDGAFTLRLASRGGDDV